MRRNSESSGAEGWGGGKESTVGGGRVRRERRSLVFRARVSFTLEENTPITGFGCASQFACLILWRLCDCMSDLLISQNLDREITTVHIDMCQFNSSQYAGLLDYDKIIIIIIITIIFPKIEITII